MKSVYVQEYPLRACDFDCHHYLQPAAILDLFQDAAGRHAIELGVGFPQLSLKNQMWILSGVQFEIVATPVMYQTVRVVTWPLPATSVTCRREYRMESLDGKLLVKGTSDWAIMDGEKRKLLRAREVYPNDLVYCEELCFEGKMPRLKDFEPTDTGMEFTPAFSDLDMNGHVNNTKYANWMMNALHLLSDRSVKMFQIHYRKELLAQNPVHLFTKQENEVVLFMGKNTAGETMFSGKIQVN